MFIVCGHMYIVCSLYKERQRENINCDEVMNPGTRYRHLQTLVTLATSGKRLERKAGVGCCIELFSACFFLTKAGRC